MKANETNLLSLGQKIFPINKELPFIKIMDEMLSALMNSLLISRAKAK